jgi:hypothetical protein
VPAGLHEVRGHRRLGDQRRRLEPTAARFRDSPALVARRPQARVLRVHAEHRVARVDGGPGRPEWRHGRHVLLGEVPRSDGFAACVVAWWPDRVHIWQFPRSAPRRREGLATPSSRARSRSRLVPERPHLGRRSQRRDLVSDPSRRHRRRLVRPAPEERLVPVWSPNGRFLACQGGNGIRVVRAVRPARPRHIGHGIPGCCGNDLGSSPPSWTRDSRRLISRSSYSSSSTSSSPPATRSPSRTCTAWTVAS